MADVWGMVATVRRGLGRVGLAAIATALALPGAAQAAGPATNISLSLSPNTIVANGTSSTTATVTITDSSTVGVPGETVALSSTDVGETIGSVTDHADGTYTATIISSTAVGTPTITAKDGSLTATATLIQTGPPANIAVALTSSSIIANGTSSTTATATVTDAEGHLLPSETVSFSSSDAGDKVGPTTNAGSGAYTATITSSTTIGTPTITATDGTASGHTSLTQTVGPPAAIAVAVSPGAIVANASSTATATATVTDAEGHGVPTDTIAFSSSDPGEFFGPVSNNGDGTYSAELRSSTRVGVATITARDSSNLMSRATLKQAAGPSNLSLVANPSTAVTDQGIILVAVVTASTGSPSGTITFEDGTTPITGCVGVQITRSNPGASCQTSFAASTSPERLTAVFTAGPASTAPGATGSTLVAVNQDAPSVSLAIAGSVQLGQSTTYSAVVTPGALFGSVLPTGSVAFFDNGEPVPSCGSQPLANGTATCSLTYEAVGQHAITARYTGDGNFSGATSAAQSIAVVANPLPATVSVPALSAVASTMQWSFSFTRSYTTILALSVKGASAKGSVLVKCRGQGCPFVTHVAVLAKPKHCGRTGKPACPSSGTINLAPEFKNQHLHIGAKITVWIRRPGWIGKSYTFVIRRGGPPGVQISCLAPGSTRPGVGC